MMKHVNVFTKIIAYIIVHYVIMSGYVIISTSLYTAIQTMRGTFDEDIFSEFFINQVLWGVVVGAVLTFIIYYLLFKGQKKDLLIISRFRRISLKQGILSLIIGASLIFLSGLIVGLLAEAMPNAFERFVDSMGQLDRAHVLPLVLAIVFAAPFIEEVMFRGVVTYFLGKHYSMAVVIIVQALLFGVYHMDVIQSSYAAVLGLILGLSLLWTGSIWVPILIHFANNLMSYLMSTPFFIDWFESEGNTYSIFVGLMLFVLLPISVALLYKDRLSQKNPSSLAYTEELE